MPITRARPSSTRYRELWKLLSLVRRRVSTVGVEEGMRDRLTRREALFLDLAERFIFAAESSPYRPLLDLAGYDLPRLRQLVSARGLDAALDQLWQDGVYIRVREFKGQEPVQRGGRTFQFDQGDFINPSIRAVTESQSSGSRSGGTRSPVSEQDFIDGARIQRWLAERYGLSRRDMVLWLPLRVGLRSVAVQAMIGQPAVRWFCPLDRIDRSYAFFTRVAGLLTGVSIPPPLPTPSERVLEVARFIARANTPRGILVTAMVNPALRLVLAAEEAGINLGDVAFITGGEPLTPTKLRQFTTRGYQVFSAFAFSEYGMAAWACPQGQEPDDLHVFTDRIALRQYPRPTDQNGATVPAYLFTSLLPETRHIMLNLESGDYGGLEVRRCGCFLDELGFHQHMHTIRSFEKLTAEGMTFIGPTLIGLMDEVLPREFGGSQTDYQLVEAEDARGHTKLYLLASPRLGDLDEVALRKTVLREIRDRHISPGDGRLIHQIWQSADTIQVLRRQPLETETGKVHHLHKHQGTLAAELQAH